MSTSDSPAVRRPTLPLLAGVTAEMPLHRIPGDGYVADAVASFLSDRPRVVTGQLLLVDAGEYTP